MLTLISATLLLVGIHLTPAAGQCGPTFCLSAFGGFFDSCCLNGPAYTFCCPYLDDECNAQFGVCCDNECCGLDILDPLCCSYGYYCCYNEYDLSTPFVCCDDYVDCCVNGDGAPYCCEYDQYCCYTDYYDTICCQDYAVCCYDSYDQVICCDEYEDCCGDQCCSSSDCCYDYYGDSECCSYGECCVPGYGCTSCGRMLRSGSAANRSISAEDLPSFSVEEAIAHAEARKKERDDRVNLRNQIRANRTSSARSLSSKSEKAKKIEAEEGAPAAATGLGLGGRRRVHPFSEAHGTKEQRKSKADAKRKGQHGKAEASEGHQKKEVAPGPADDHRRARANQVAKAASLTGGASAAAAARSFKEGPMMARRMQEAAADTNRGQAAADMNRGQARADFRGARAFAGPPGEESKQERAIPERTGMGA